MECFAAAEGADMDLPDFFGERLAHFSGLTLGGDGALEPKRRMSPDGVIEPADVSGDGVICLLAGLPGDRPDQLRFNGLEERLDHRIEAPMFVKRQSAPILVCTGHCISPARCIV